MNDTGELLQRYSRTGCEQAFRELVARHVALVYSTALRKVAGDTHLAEDVAQVVFSDLARKAGSLPKGVVLAGWLYRHTCLKVAEMIRAASRRRVREQHAANMNNLLNSGEPAWHDIAPELDEAMQRLDEIDRDALVLRFFQNANLRTVGDALGISEDAAQKRVARALDRLRAQLAGQGVTCSAAALLATLTVHAAPAAPAGLAATLATAALTATASATAGAATTATALQLMATTKLKLIAAAIVAAGVTTPLILEYQALHRARAENSALRQQLASVQQASPSAPIPAGDPDTQELVRLRAEHDELLRLRGQVAQLRRERDDLLRKAQPTVRSNATVAAAQPPADSAWVQQVLASPPAQQGSAAGAVRRKTLRSLTNTTNSITASDLALRDALLQQNLNQTLERSPADFAAFQAGFIQELLGLSDATKVDQIRELIRVTYEHAVAQGLDIPSKPATDTEAWVQQRHQLDRQATAALKELLTPEERRIFGRAFIGVMGVDLGGVGVDRSNYPRGFLGPD